VEGDAIRCVYHGWKFEHDGRCIEQPAEESRFANKICIKSYPVRDYLGLVFTFLGEGEPPEFPLHPEFEYFEGMIEVDSYRRDCNYFQNIDNALDHCHLGSVHGDLARGALNDVVLGRAIKVEEGDWGLTLTFTRHDGQLFISQFGMPNMLQVAALPADAEIGWKESLFWWVPIDDVRHMQFGIATVRATGEAARHIYERDRPPASTGSGGDPRRAIGYPGRRSEALRHGEAGRRHRAGWTATHRGPQPRASGYFGYRRRQGEEAVATRAAGICGRPDAQGLEEASEHQACRMGSRRYAGADPCDAGGGRPVEGANRRCTSLP
jgi:hypothetical protein